MISFNGMVMYNIIMHDVPWNLVKGFTAHMTVNNADEVLAIPSKWCAGHGIVPPSGIAVWFFIHQEPPPYRWYALQPVWE